MTDKTVFTLESITGITFYIPNEQALCGEILGPFVAEVTDNKVLFLKSLNKSDDTLKVGYTVLDGTLHRYEAVHVYIPYNPKMKKGGHMAWVDYAQGCYETSATFGNLATCEVMIEVHGLSDCEAEPTRSFAYKPPTSPKPPTQKPAGEAPKPLGELDKGWVMI